jgi:hypothetical protein
MSVMNIKGFRLQLDNKLLNVTSLRLMKSKEGKNASLIKFNNKIYYLQRRCFHVE